MRETSVESLERDFTIGMGRKEETQQSRNVDVTIKTYVCIYRIKKKIPVKAKNVKPILKYIINLSKIVEKSLQLPILRAVAFNQSWNKLMLAPHLLASKFRNCHDLCKLQTDKLNLDKKVKSCKVLLQTAAS